ncbi:type I-E CRISPR-associated protein Cse2/CasB [Pseudorhodobacter sp. W20_MBD10_FR17]|uniref:type I-E CRISPR-associated protein Cse2/CasB n=1 Tax=Pseudorhodobacter sp. W20_MBD10_FR17 TaxID=3240266 RepID=UPI003F97D3D1
MTDEDKTPGQIILGWWGRALGDRERPAARALAARLRRAGPIEALVEREVQELARALSLGPNDAPRLARLVCLLAELRDHVAAPLAARLGGAEPVLSTLRFQRLMRAEGDELVPLLRRAIGMADGKANIAALGADLLFWNDKTRARWCFQYFGAETPADMRKEMTQ